MCGVWRQVGTCHEQEEGGDAQRHALAADEFASRNTPFLAEMRRRHGREGSMVYDPCISRQTPLYMRRPDVLKAIHADSHPNPKWPGDRPGWKCKLPPVSVSVSASVFSL